MKKTLLFLILVSIFGCSKDDNFRESITFRNTTDFIVTVQSAKNPTDYSPPFEIVIPKGESKTYKSDYRYSSFRIFSTESDRVFNFNYKDGVHVIYSVEDAVKYKITGTAKSVVLTYRLPYGGSQQRNATLPFEIKYAFFNSEFKSILAENNTKDGSIKVELYIDDILIDSDNCDSEYCSAIAKNYD